MINEENMLFKDLFKLIYREPFIIKQWISDPKDPTHHSGAWIVTRDCRSSNNNLDKQMDEEVVKFNLYTNDDHAIIELYLSNKYC